MTDFGKVPKLVPRLEGEGRQAHRTSSFSSFPPAVISDARNFFSSVSSCQSVVKERSTKISLDDDD